MTNPPDFNEQIRSRRRWLPSEVQPEGQRASLYGLAASMRRAIELMMDSDAPSSLLDQAAADIEQIARHLEDGPRGRALWGYAETSNAGDAGAGFDNSPLVGPANPIAPPLKLRVEGDLVYGDASFGRQYEGPPDHVHGGIVSAAFDEVLGMVQSLTGNPGMTGRLVVNYRRPTPLFRDLLFKGWVDRVEGRKIYTAGTLHDGDTLCAEAEGLFISVDFSRLRDIAAQRQQDRK